MAPNSRPPLTSRIRASFEGRRKSFEGTRKLSKSGRGTTADSNGAQEVRSPTAIDSEVDSPLHTNGFSTQDPDSIRNAVDQAINGEAFQTAMAANLAKLIKPSIKSALDTIQPVVEAVYAHEMLLRKTNQSVEDVLSRMDTNAETAAAVRRESFIDSTYVAPGTPADGEKSADAVEGAVRPRDISGPDYDQFKQLMEEYNAKTLATISEAIEPNTTKIVELAQVVSDLNASVGPTKDSIESLKSASEQANTTSSVLQAQLDQLKLDIGQIIEAIGADLGKNIQAISEKSGAPDADLLSSHTTKLDLITTDLAALKGHADTVEKIDAISSELGALKASVDAGNTSNAEGFTNVLAAVGEHNTVLGEIKEKEPHPDILAALQKSNDSHALHSTTLSELKERSLGSAPAPVVSEGGSVDHSAALEQIRTDLTALKENIAAGLTTNNDLGAKIDTVLTTIEEHKAGDSGLEILAAVKQSNESHAAHAAALEGLNTNNTDVSPELGTQITGIVGKLDEHSAVLEEIKTFGGTHTAALEGIKSTLADPPVDAGDLTAQISAIIAKLDTHTAVLHEIKGASSTNLETTPAATGDLATQIEAIVTKLDTHAAALDDIKGLSGAHAIALESHGTALESIRSVAPEAAAADTSDLTTQISTIVAKLDSHTAALDEIKGIGGPHATALEGIKSINPENTSTPDNSELTTHITAIVSKLDEHTSALDEIKGHGASHVSALENHGTALESIKSLGVSAPAEGGNTDLDGQIAAIVATLEKHGAALDEIKNHTTTIESHGSILDEIKTSTGAHTTALEGHGVAIEGIKSLSAAAPTEGGNSALEAQIAAIIATLDTHGSALDEIKTSTGTHSTALESHGSALESPKSLNAEPAPEATDASGLESQIGAIITTLKSHSAALDEIKASGGAHSSILDEIKTFGTTHATALEGHGTLLEGIKARSVEQAPVESGSAALETQIIDIAAKLESHSATLEEIKASTGSHTSVLDEIKLASTTHANVLEALKSPGIPAATADPMNLAALEIQIGSIISTLETHSAAWNEIKARNDPASTVVVPTDTGSESGKPEGPFATIIETLMLHTNLLNEIKEDVAAEILTALHDMGQTQANQTNLLTEIREADLDDEILTLLHASSESHANHTSALDKIHSAVLVSNDSHTAHATSLDEIKSRSIEPAAPAREAPELGDLKEKISSIAEKLEEYSATLSAIKDATAASNDLHAAHATSLDEIKSRSVEPAPAESSDLGALETQITGIVTKLDGHTAVLSAIKDATSVSNESHTAHTAVLAQIKEKTESSVESHTAHATLLGEIKDATLASKEFHTAHGTSLSELKETTSGFNDNHAATLSEIKEATLASKDAHASHTAAFAELKSIQPSATSAPENNDLSTLEAQITSILSSLESQTTTLSAIKEGTATANPEILAAIQQSHDLLTSHGPLLESIKEGTSHDDILANISELKSIIEDSKADVASHGALVKDLHAETKDSHSNLASAIGALAVGGAAGAGATALLSKDDEPDSAVLDEVKAVRALIETSAANAEGTKEKVTSLASQIEINHTTITTSISTLSDEVKAEIDASGTGIVESITTLDGSIKAIDISPLATSLEQQGAELKALSAQVDTLNGNVEDNNTHITTLHSGVHLNDTGIDQLREHVGSRSVPAGEVANSMPMTEGAWFGSARSGSRSPTLSRVASRNLTESVPEGQEQQAEVIDAGDGLSETDEVVEAAVVEPESVTDSADERPEGVLSPIVEEESPVEAGVSLEEDPVAKEVEDDLPQTEVVEAEPSPEEQAIIDPSAEEPQGVSEVVDDISHSPEEPTVEVEPAVEDLAEDKEVVVNDDPPKEEEFSSESQIEEPAAIGAPVVEPDSAPAVDEDVQVPIEDPVADTEPVVEELARTREIGVDDDMSKPEEVPEEPEVAADLDAGLKAAEVAEDKDIPPLEAAVLDKESEPLPAEEAIEADPTPTADEVKAIDNLVSEAAVEKLDDTPAGAVDQELADEAQDTIVVDTKDESPLDKQAIAGNATLQTDASSLEPEQVVDTNKDDLELQPASPELIVEEGMLEKTIEEGSQPPTDDSVQTEVKPDEALGETSTDEVAEEHVTADETHPDVEVTKDIDEPSFKKPLEVEINDDTDLTESAPVGEEPPVANSASIETPVAEDLGSPELKTDESVIEQPAVVEDLPEQDSPSIEGLIDPPANVDLPEGTTVYERELQSGDNSVTGGAQSELGDDQARTVENTEDLPTPKTVEQFESTDLAPIKSEGQTSRPVSPIVDSMDNDAPGGTLSPTAPADVDSPNALKSHPAVLEHDESPPSPDAEWPLSTHETVQTSSPFIESPAVARDLDEPHTSSPIEQAPFLPSAHQNLLGDQGLDSGHATPLDDARSNPFEDSDNLLSPSSVLAPEAEIDALTFPVRERMESIDESGFVSPESGNFARPPTFPVFPGTTQHATQKRFEDSDDVMSPSSEYDAPVFSDTRQRAPAHFAEHGYDPHTPQPTFPSFPTTGQRAEQGGFEDSDDVMSPSSEYNAPGFTDVRQRTPQQNQPLDSPEFTPAPSFPVFPGTGQRVSQQHFDDSDDAMSPGSGYDARGMTQGSSFQRQRTPVQPQALESPDFTPAPSFPVFPGTGQHMPQQQQFDDSDDAFSPRTGYDARGIAQESPFQRQRTPVHNEPFDSPELTPAPAFPVFPGTSQQHMAPQRFDESDDARSPGTGYDAHGLPHMTQESPFETRHPDTSYDPSSPQYERGSAFQPRGLQRESSFDYPQENYEPAMLPRGIVEQPAQRYEDDDFRTPHDATFVRQGLGRRSPLQPLDDDDYRAGQYERYSPEPEFSDLRQRSPVGSAGFDDSHGTLPPHLQLGSAFPAPRQRSPIQPFEDEYSSPRQQRYSPEPESSPFIQRQYSPQTTPPRQPTLPPHLQLDTPAFRSSSPIDPYSERDAEIVSPSSEFAVPVTPGMSAKPAASPTAPADDPRSPESEWDEPSFPSQSQSQSQFQKGKAIASPGPLSPDLGSPAEFGFSREETETEADSALASPTSPVFSEGGTTVAEKSSGGGKKKKGKKEKKEKGGGGKKKKEKVPFEMEGEDAE